MPAEPSPVTISVIIATYNRAALLPEALDSVLAQTRAPDEIIVVDDGSSDDTALVAARYAPRVRYLHQANQGRGAAFNNALAVSECSHFCFFDDDDLMLADGLENHLSALAADPDADYSYSPNLIYDDAPGKTISDESGWRQSKHCQIAEPDTLFVKTLEWGEHFLTFMQGMLVPGRCLRAVGLFQPDLLRGQDYDMMLKLARRYRGLSTIEPTFVMRNHSGARGPAAERHTEDERLAMWAKYDRLIVLPYRAALPLAEYLPVCGEARNTHELAPDQIFAALLERSRIMFSHGFFAEGIEDIAFIGRDCQLSAAQLDAVRLVVQEAANIEKHHYLDSATLIAREIAKHCYAWDSKKLILTDILRGFYWASLRFLRHREVSHSAALVYAMLLVAPRRLKLVA